MPKNKNKTHTNARKNRNLKNKKNKTNTRKNRNLKNTRKKRTRNTKKNLRGGANRNELMKELAQLTKSRNLAYNSTGASGYNANRNERIKALSGQLGLPTGINLRGNRGPSRPYTRTDTGTWRRNNTPIPEPESPEHQLVFIPGSVHNKALNMNQKAKASNTPKKQTKLPTMRLLQGDFTSGAKHPGQAVDWISLMKSEKAGDLFSGKRRVFRHKGDVKYIKNQREARKGQIIPGTNTVRPRGYSENHGVGLQPDMNVKLRERILPSQIRKIQQLSKLAKSSGVSPSTTARNEQEKMRKFMESKPSKQSLRRLTKKSKKTPSGSLFDKNKVQGPGFGQGVDLRETTL